MRKSNGVAAIALAVFQHQSVQPCPINPISRESKDELADFPAWAERLREGG